MSVPAPERTETSAEMREFLLVLRQALLMLVRFIEKKYSLCDTMRRN